MLDPYSLDGRRMRVVSSDARSVVTSGTCLIFTENDRIISARYEGGNIKLGCLVGRRIGQSATFRYAQVSTSDELDGGVSNCELLFTSDGRLRVVEHYHWESREGDGTNIFEEILKGES